ncbi:FMN-binding negative transcriptional regulator [Candidatus Gracilibacteria bacterium]|jgi:transcriptional regulator|nr:FMN-binding negative transcriptional regulator [Candidatus Gracilibacteria bacterium]NJM88242.1 FMN-binding negative transcriptional regulator [Hydrococcus sp. RU_2_2]NJP18140.1 FMN-binding negative transcriptional regulator [Hydrococcus sp. CRU_1_1]
MYRPKAFQEDNIDKLVAFMRANSFATLVSIADGIPCASHIPLVVKVEEDVVYLIGHLAKQNPQWQAFEAGESLAIFTGAHAYISPTLYEKHESVPTWNYIAVHAYGIPKILTFDDSPGAMEKMIDEMINTYEADYNFHWQGLSNGFREGMMNGIVGFKMTVTCLEGKYKLSQNRSQAEQQNVSNTLLQSSDPIVRSVGVQMKQNLESDK